MADRPPLAADDPRHGTPNGYFTLKCKCDSCRDAGRAYRSTNKSKLQTQNREWRAKNKGRIQDYEESRRGLPHRRRAARAYYSANAERLRQAEAARRVLKAEEIAQQRRSPQGRAAGRAKSRRRRERARARYCGCDTYENLAAVWLLDSGRCAYCDAPGTDYEHVVPLAKGGWGCVSNFRVACKSCNSKKGTKPLSEFLARLAASGVTVRPGATNSGLPCPAAAERMSRRMLTA